MSKLNNDELRQMVKSVISQAGEQKAEIFKIQRVKSGELPGVLIEYTMPPHNIRSCQFWLINNHQILLIRLESKKRTYKQRMQEFEAVLSTIKFDDKGW